MPLDDYVMRLPDRDRRRARMVLMRHAYKTATDEELQAVWREYHDEWALLQGDWHDGDMTVPGLQAQITWCEWNIKEIEYQMARRLRAGVARRDTESTEDWSARFDAMRQNSIVEGLGLVGLDLVKRGREWKAQCPFHDDRTPSLSVNEDKGVWTCYSCHRGGDLVEYVCLLYGKSRGEALSWLESLFGSVAEGAMNRPPDTHE